MQLFFVVAGSILSILFMLQLKKGERFEAAVENLDENAYPLNALYGVGFAWNETKLLKLKGKIATELKTQATLLFETKYAEYYATIAWVQMLTFVHLFMAVTFLMAGIMNENFVMMLVAGIFMCILTATYALQNMKNTLSERTAKCEAQLAEVVSTMAILVNSGMMLREAWNMIAESGDDALRNLMKKASVNMQNGYSDADAIFIFGRETNSIEIKKFTSALLQSMEKGGAELSVFLAQQSSELWNTKRQHMLQSGEKAATKLLLPIVLIFVGIIIIVITAAFAGSLF